jgi:hypothetical protein
VTSGSFLSFGYKKQIPFAVPQPPHPIKSAHRVAICSHEILTTTPRKKQPYASLSSPRTAVSSLVGQRLHSTACLHTPAIDNKHISSADQLAPVLFASLPPFNPKKYHPPALPPSANTLLPSTVKIMVCTL